MAVCCGSKWRGSALGAVELTDRELEIIRQVGTRSQLKEDEITRFYLAFKNLAIDDRLDQGGFKKLMMLMGIRISKGIENRIFRTIERFSTRSSFKHENRVELSSNAGFLPGIDFQAIVTYFDNLLNGDQQDDYSNKFIFNLINQDNKVIHVQDINLSSLMGPVARAGSEQKNYITGQDLENFLLEIESSEIDKDEKYIAEIQEEIHYLAISIFKDMGLNFTHHLEFEEFTRILNERPEIKDIFREFGSSITNLLDVQGQNKYTKIVKILSEVKDKFFNTVLQSKEIRDVVPIGATQLGARMSVGGYHRNMAFNTSMSPNSLQKSATLASFVKSGADKQAQGDGQGFSLFARQNANFNSFANKDSEAAESQKTVRLNESQVRLTNENAPDNSEHNKPGSLQQFENMDTFRLKPLDNLRTGNKASNQHDQSKASQMPIFMPKSQSPSRRTVQQTENPYLIQQDDDAKDEVNDDREEPTWQTVKDNYGSSMVYLAKLSKKAHERAVAVERRFE